MIDIHNLIYRARRWLANVIAPAPKVIDLRVRMGGKPDPRYDPKQHRRR